MARKSIFDLVDENYNIQEEIEKIDKLFIHGEHFSRGRESYSLMDIIIDVLFNEWEYKGTCLDIREYIERVNAVIIAGQYHTEETMINFLEMIENFVDLYYKKQGTLHFLHRLTMRSEFEGVFLKLLTTIEKKMGLVKRKNKKGVVLYPENAALEQVLNNTDDEDVQWDLIRYSRENLSLSEKRKLLASFATNLYIEADSSEGDEPIKVLMSKATNILNNLHIRHNNKEGKWSSNSVLSQIDESEANALCDMAFNQILVIVLLREQRKYEEVYKNFTKKQKQAKVKQND